MHKLSLSLYLTDIVVYLNHVHILFKQVINFGPIPKMSKDKHLTVDVVSIINHAF
jgi:hypothetical protein